VAAERCVVADALTKVVLAQGARSTDLLRRYRATAHVHSSWHGWRTFGAQA
jgi:thiamine biosynthesis lipoprotein